MADVGQSLGFSSACNRHHHLLSALDVIPYLGHEHGDVAVIARRRLRLKDVLFRRAFERQMLEQKLRPSRKCALPFLWCQKVSIRRGRRGRPRRLFEFGGETFAPQIQHAAQCPRLIFEHDRVRHEFEQARFGFVKKSGMKFPARIKSCRHAFIFTARHRAFAESIEDFIAPRIIRQRQQCRAFERAQRALAIRIELAQRFERVAEKFEPYRRIRLRRKHIHNPAANRELSR